jgi:hypothetical protein
VVEFCLGKQGSGGDGEADVRKGTRKARKPRRTRQHIIASLSRNYVERFILVKGHTAERRIDDYGYDLDVETYDEDGYIEGGLIRIQLKATDKLEARKRGDCVWVRVDARHYDLWIDEPMPVFLILYDAQERRAYWVHVQEYFAANASRKPKRGAKTLRVYIPLANELTEDTVDRMRTRKAEIWARDRRRR